MKEYKDSSYVIRLNAALLESSMRFENIKLFKEAYSQRYLNYSQGFLKNKDILLKVYLVLLTPRFCKIKIRGK
ncbi:MAG: hypothetical protein JWR50_2636 [Mucilaginibacter sp.]|nr:hypothetical protein [Mucilaginibacter sp.]